MGIKINRLSESASEPEGERPVVVAGRAFIRDESAFGETQTEEPMADEELVIHIDASREKEVKAGSKEAALILRGDDAEKWRAEHGTKVAKQVENKAVENKDTK